MLANLTTPLLGIVGTSAIGQLGEASLLGGVAMASVALDCLFWLFGFLRMGTIAFTAQALGARDIPEIRAVLARALLLALASGLSLLLLQLPLGRIVFGLMGGSDAATGAAQRYFAIRLWAAPFALANYVLLGWFVGQARAKLALGLQITISLANMSGILVLVVALGQGVAGAAWAAALAETIGCVIGLAAAWRTLHGRLDGIGNGLFDRTKLARLFAVNRDILIRTAAVIGAFFFFTAQGARAGDVTLAANSVLYNFIMIGSFFLDGLANAAEQLCGQHLGARDAAGFARAAKLVLLWSGAFGAALTVSFFIFNGPLIALMTASPAVLQAAHQYLPYAALTPLFGVMAYCFDGIFIGATWARDMRNLMLAALLTYVIAWYALYPFGNAGLWIALLIFLASRGIYQALRFPALRRQTFAGATAERIIEPI